MPNTTTDNAKASSEIEHVDWSTGSGQNYANVRFGSASSQASQSSGDICRICHCESDPQNPLLTPCYCSGSLKYVHQACLQQWLTASETNACELCKFPFIMHTKIKPFNEWRSLDISGIERRRLCCSLLFHCAAALCVIWSLCVLIERAADDVQRGLIDWPFWTKLAVVTVGMTGGIVFMYIQCKAYLHLCHRWKARNRILLIQNAPEKIHPLTPPSPLAQCHATRRGGSLGDTTARTTDRDRASVCASTAVEIPDNMGTVAATLGSYSYARGSGSNRIDSDIDDSRAASSSVRCHHHNMTMHSHHHHTHLPHSPNHMLPQSDLDADSLATQASLSSAIGGHSNILNHYGQQHHHQLLGGGGGGSSSTGSGGGGSVGCHQLQHPMGQVAVAANIECTHSQHNYERDWALDDVVSQISSFRPCQQGSGSMTPFHDSIHNVLEHSEECSSRDSRQNLSTGGVSSDMGRDLTMQLSSFSGSGENKPPSIGSGASNAVANGLGGFVYKPHNKRYSNSSIFIENGDSMALNDDGDTLGLEIASDFPKTNYRHSGIPISSPECISGGDDIGGNNDGQTTTNTAIGHSCSDVSAGNNTIDNEQLEKFLSRHTRRYSDTKVISSSDQHDLEAHEPMLQDNIDNVENACNQRQNSTTTEATAMLLSYASPPITYDDGQGQRLRQQQQQRPRHAELQNIRRSIHTVDMGDPISSTTSTITSRQSENNCKQNRATQYENGRVLFKSLPNLSSSCESLIKK